MITISVPEDEPRWSQTIELDEVDYILEGEWNVRREGWLLNVRAEDGAPIALGLGAVLGLVGENRRHLEGFPPGCFYCLDTTGSGQEAGETDLGQRVLLLYLNAEEANLLVKILLVYRGAPSGLAALL